MKTILICLHICVSSLLVSLFLCENETATEQNIEIVYCELELSGVSNNTKFCHQWALIKGQVKCPKYQSTYVNSLEPNQGRFVNIFYEEHTGLPNEIQTWPVSTLHEFKLIATLRKGLNLIRLDYDYYELYENNSLVYEKASFEIHLFYEENMDLIPLSLGVLLANDSKHVFDMDIESKRAGERNDLTSALKRVKTAALLMQLLTSESLFSHGLERKTFRLELDSNNGFDYNF